VIGKDRIVPAESDPVDLSVFCVEPGRWVATSNQFGASGTTYASGNGSGIGAGSAGSAAGRSICWELMAQPSVRAKAMGDKDPKPGLGGGQKAATGDDGRGNGGTFAANADEIRSTSSYARVMENKDVKQKVDDIAAPIEHNYKV